MYARASSRSVKHSYCAVGMLLSIIRRLANDLSDSMRAALAPGPKQETPGGERR